MLVGGRDVITEHIGQDRTATDSPRSFKLFLPKIQQLP
jgi:hypothetical protein